MYTGITPTTHFSAQTAAIAGSNGHHQTPQAQLGPVIDTVKFGWGKNKEAKERAARINALIKAHNEIFSSTPDRLINVELNKDNVNSTATLQALLKLTVENPLKPSNVELPTAQTVLDLLKEVENSVSNRGTGGSYNVARAYCTPEGLQHPDNNIRKYVVSRVKDLSGSYTYDNGSRYNATYFNQDPKCFEQITNALIQETNLEISKAFVDLVASFGRTSANFKDTLVNIYKSAGSPEAEYYALSRLYQERHAPDQDYVTHLFEFLDQDFAMMPIQDEASKTAHIATIIVETADESFRSIYEDYRLSGNKTISTAAEDALLRLQQRKKSPHGTGKSAASSVEEEPSRKKSTKERVKNLVNEILGPEDDW
jgi:hypothetical protein